MFHTQAWPITKYANYMSLENVVLNVVPSSLHSTPLGLTSLYTSHPFFERHTKPTLSKLFTLFLPPRTKMSVFHIICVFDDTPLSPLAKVRN